MFTDSGTIVVPRARRDVRRAYDFITGDRSGLDTAIDCWLGEGGGGISLSVDGLAKCFSLLVFRSGFSSLDFANFTLWSYVL